MGKNDLVQHHLIEAVRGAAAEAEGNDRLARQLHAATRLRLITMSDDELWHLSEVMAASLGKPVDLVFEKFKESIARHRLTAAEWINDLQKECPSGE
jgi:hypothetical protein